MSTQSIKEALASIPLFGEVSEEHLRRIASESRELHVKRGVILFNKGDPSSGFYFVIDGQIKLAFLTHDGNEKVLEIIPSGMSFGEAVMFLRKPAPVYAQATRESHLVFIPRDAVVREIEADHHFALAMLSGLSMRLHRIVRDVEDFTLHSSSQRVIGYLLRNEVGDCPERGAYTIELPASKALIASRLNLTPETFSRVLHHLQEESLLEVKGRNIHILDVEKLMRFGSEP
ncbi:MAG: Crp/Fnr family transcriptional regulator [Gammaproteobacteria bacterium]